MTKRKAIKKNDPEFEEFFRNVATLNEETGEITFKEAYVYLGMNVSFKSSVVSFTYANAVWFLKTGRWPKLGHHIDHINDNSLDNRPTNLQEITELENQRKRRGRIVYRSYGTGKYGYGFVIHHDKRDGRYYLKRYLSRGHGGGELKTKRICLGGFATLTEAEIKVANYIEAIKANGLDYVPPHVKRAARKDTLLIDAMTEEMRRLRRAGKTIQEIADITGIKFGSVYNRIKDIVPE